jgi:hypothetical protein
MGSLFVFGEGGKSAADMMRICALFFSSLFWSREARLFIIAVSVLFWTQESLDGAARHMAG